VPGRRRIFRETGDRHSEGSALGNFGSALSEAHMFDAAITACQDAIGVFRGRPCSRRPACGLR
jgi:hypothetical protein